MKSARFYAAAASIALASALTVATVATPAQAAPAKAAPAVAAAASAISAPVTGHFTDTLGATGTLAGTFTPTKFVASGNQLFSEGLLTGSLVDSTGQSVGAVSQTVSLPVTPQAGNMALVSCQILNLVLGPLDLNLLGLVVHLDTVHLNITAQAGPGNLLGNLLCAIAGLLNGGLPNLDVLTALLNLLLALLGGIG